MKLRSLITATALALATFGFASIPAQAHERGPAVSFSLHSGHGAVSFAHHRDYYAKPYRYAKRHARPYRGYRHQHRRAYCPSYQRYGYYRPYGRHYYRHRH